MDREVSRQVALTPQPPAAPYIAARCPLRQARGSRFRAVPVWLHGGRAFHADPVALQTPSPVEAPPRPLRWARGLGGEGNPLLRLALLARFLLFQRHRHRRLVLEHVDDLPLIVLPDVFNPVLFRTGAMLARSAAQIVTPDSRVLDLGCGAGAVGLAAARAGAQVTALDINTEAIRCTRLNAILNGLEDRIEVRQGDLFAPVQGECFDLIFFNPPYVPGAPREPWEYAWRSNDVLERFTRELPDRLLPGGRAILALSTVAHGAEETLLAGGLRLHVLDERRLLTERLSIVEVMP